MGRAQPAPPWVQVVMYAGAAAAEADDAGARPDQLEVSIAALNAVLKVEGAEVRSSEDLVGVEVVA